MEKVKIVVILGPTASGKSLAAIELAKIFNAEIVSADSMQVYRFMDIGTAKPSRKEKEDIKHHLVDIANPDEEYTAARFKNEASKAIEDIHKRGKNIFIVGGTGLYIKALTKGLFKGAGKNERLRNDLKDISEKKGGYYLYEMLKRVDPVSASKIHPNNEIRVIRALEVYYTTSKPLSSFQMEHGFREEPYKTLRIGIAKERKKLYQDIETRVDNMIDAGLIDEVKRLVDMGYSPELKSMNALGYKEVNDYLNGRLSLDNLLKEIKKNTKRYAKRQITWFKKETDIKWLDADDRKGMISMIKAFLNEKI